MVIGIRGINIMISKEKLLNGYIENDQGKLRKLFVEAATSYGYVIPFDEDIYWLDYETIYTDEKRMDIVTGLKPTKNNKLTIEDFVNTDCKPEITKTLIPSDVTKEALMEVKNYTFTSSDIFQQMLTLAEQHNMFIQFDGMDECSSTIVVSKQGSDTEYVIDTQEQFNQLVESFNVLEKFERS
ncbi:hypothetical protein vBVpaMR16F_55 [Vibrio phage vB_VpaM_R16F]|nr:hypothetical protein vBVpaMR16F_55 [Vibrio phage vB_VpaM_R16F]